MLIYKSEEPLVSICIPVYNAEKTIVNTLQSILNQTYQHLEIIIVDNNSTDHTLDLLKRFTDPRIKKYKNDTNIGAEKNFSRCIELATGEYIAIFHSDDLYRQDIVQKEVKAFRDNPYIGAVFTLANLINERDEVFMEHRIPVELKDNKPHNYFEILTSILINGNFLMTSSAMVRSEIYKELMPFNSEEYGTSADLDMWLRILKKSPIIILNEKMMDYRISNMQGGFLYNNLRTEKADFFKVVDSYLSDRNCAVKNIHCSALNNYELQRYVDNLTRAVNYTIKGQPQNTKKLLKESISNKVFGTAIRRIEEPYLLAFFLFGVTLLFLTYLKLEKYPCKMFNMYLYRKY
jgi:glycosyltransferase involved in cell wall biosynthesis